jgi:hypothetical protein
MFSLQDMNSTPRQSSSSITCKKCFVLRATRSKAATGTTDSLFRSGCNFEAVSVHYFRPRRREEVFPTFLSGVFPRFFQSRQTSRLSPAFTVKSANVASVPGFTVKSANVPSVPGFSQPLTSRRHHHYCGMPVLRGVRRVGTGDVCGNGYGHAAAIEHQTSLNP